MSPTGKQQSNPFSTGGGGVNFETRIQASFLLMMLTSGDIPCLPSGYKANKLKLQGKYTGFDTDDFILYAGSETNSSIKLYVQIKHDISIGDGENTLFAEVIDSAWRDFTNKSFNKSLDVFALITGPLASTDIQSVRPLLEWARHCETAEEYFKKIDSKGFSS